MKRFVDAPRAWDRGESKLREPELMLRIASSGIAIFVLALAAAASPAGQDEAKDNMGFVHLFNGKDLTGWVTPADKSLFTVEDGEIVGRTKGDLKKNEFLVTARPYRDFVLRAKVKIRNGNSGIQIRSKRREDGAVSGPQADVAEGFWGLLYEERGRGILERYPEDKANELVKKNDWNEIEITAIGKRLVIHLNGVIVIDRKDAEFADEGIIALQVHVGPAMEVRYKDLLIKPMPPQ